MGENLKKSKILLCLALVIGMTSCQSGSNNKGNNSAFKSVTQPFEDLTDSDNDGLPDRAELTYNTDPNVADTDGDGLLDGPEVFTYKTNPAKADSDDGGADDKLEISSGTNPRSSDDDNSGESYGQKGSGKKHKYKDSDGDGLSDGAEIHFHKTDPYKADSDYGGLDDGIEVRLGKNPNDPSDDQMRKHKDSDKDGLPDWLELVIGTHPNCEDTDEDGLLDIEELLVYGTNPKNKDTDRGGLSDGYEVENGLNPLKKRDDRIYLNDDLDNDGLTNKEEMESGTDKNNPDTDKDGLKDGDEVKRYGTDPTEADTDRGGVEDGVEVEKGMDPQDPRDDKRISKCGVKTKRGVWLDPSNSKNFRNAIYQGRLKSYKDKTISSIENYDYNSYSAHPKVGPQPEKNRLKFFMFKGNDGLMLTFFAGEDNANDGEWKNVEFDIMTRRNKRRDQLVLSDDSSEVQMIKTVDKRNHYKAKLRYKNNSDGGVIGPFSKNAVIHVQFLNTEGIDSAVVVDVDGTEYDLSAQEGGFSSFIIGAKRTRHCGDGDNGDDSDDGDDGDDNGDDNDDDGPLYTDITIVEAPEAFTEETSGRFRFTLTNEEDIRSIECSLDNAPFADCSGLVVNFSNLTPGQHRFDIRVTMNDDTVFMQTYIWTITELDEPIEVTCENTNPITKVVAVKFSEFTNGCAWEQGENLERRAGFLQAVHRQVVNVDLSANLPAGSQVCGGEVGQLSQDFEFNDHFAISLNGVALVSDMNFALTQNQSGQRIFDWSVAKGAEFYQEDRKFCLGEGEGTTCTVPTDGLFGRGELNLSIPNSVLAPIVQKSSTSSFELVTTGDNNSIDCRNSELEFEFSVKYVPGNTNQQ